MTVFARIFQHKIQFFLASEDSFLECDANALSDISPFHRTVACATSSGTTEHISEDISENVAEICSIEVKSAAESTCSAAGTAIKCSVAELIADKELRRKIQPERYLSPTVGMPTLKDILQELEKPGRDPRGPIKVFEFDKNVRTIDDLRIGMELPGIVGNITNFGAFVDIGIKENGLIHLSQLAQKYVSNPNEIVSIHQQVRVKVLSVDTERKRIQLTMIGVSG